MTHTDLMHAIARLKVEHYAELVEMLHQTMDETDTDDKVWVELQKMETDWYSSLQFWRAHLSYRRNKAAKKIEAAEADES